MPCPQDVPADPDLAIRSHHQPGAWPWPATAAVTSRHPHDSLVMRRSGPGTHPGHTANPSDGNQAKTTSSLVTVSLSVNARARVVECPSWLHALQGGRASTEAIGITRPVSCHRSPADKRSVACCARCLRSAWMHRSGRVSAEISWFLCLRPLVRTATPPRDGILSGDAKHPPHGNTATAGASQRTLDAATFDTQSIRSARRPSYSRRERTTSLTIGSRS